MGVLWWVLYGGHCVMCDKLRILYGGYLVLNGGC